MKRTIEWLFNATTADIWIFCACCLITGIILIKLMWR